LLFSVCFATGYIHSGEIKIFDTFSLLFKSHFVDSIDTFDVIVTLRLQITPFPRFTFWAADLPLSMAKSSHFCCQAAFGSFVVISMLGSGFEHNRAIGILSRTLAFQQLRVA